MEKITGKERQKMRDAYIIGAVVILLGYAFLMAVSGLEWWVCVLISFGGWFLGYFIDKFQSRSAGADELR